MQALVRRHWPVALVLAGGAVLRAAAGIGFRPALFYSDSWDYLASAAGDGLVGFAPLRPSGYPLALSLLPGDLAATTTVQHLAGLAAGAAVYALLLRLGVRRWLATGATAVVVLDAWAIALEQHVLAESLFALAIVLAVALTLWRPAPGAWELAGAGAVLAAATLMRPVGLAAGAAWVAWVAWRRPGWRAASAGAAALAVPLIAYALAHGAATGTVGLTQADGWFLYGRVGEIATCDAIGPRPLCTPTAAEGPNFWIFNRRSPARRELGGISSDSDRQAHTNRRLRDFALEVIADRPLAYARLVARDLLKYLRPGPVSRYGEDATIRFDRLERFDQHPLRARLYPGLVTHERDPGLDAYARVAHTSRPLLALLVLASLAALVLRRLERRAAGAVALTLGMALSMLLATAMTAGFALRYLVPQVAILIVSGTLSVQALGKYSGIRAES